MNNSRPEIFPLIVAIIALIGIILLQALGHSVPDVLNIVATGGLVGGAAISSPRTPPAA